MDHPGTSGSLQVGNAHRSSLYVTGLRPETGEMELFEKFTTVGPLDSIRMVREMITFRPLGSAYVNFQRTQDGGFNKFYFCLFSFFPVEKRFGLR